MAYEKIKNIIKQKSGLDIYAFDRDEVNRKIDDYLLSVNCQNVEDFEELIEINRGEFISFLEIFVRTRSLFFREPATFDAFKVWVNSGRKHFTSGKLRILSVGCSTGEEPYSIAISLLENGLKPGDFQIDAFDISPKVIESAIQAVYTESSLVSMKLNSIEKYFNQAEDIYILNPAIAHLVNFSLANIIEDYLHFRKQYHVIFICYMIMFLCPEAKDKAIKNLIRLLDDKGIMLTAPHELQYFSGNALIQKDKDYPLLTKVITTDKIHDSPIQSKKSIKNKFRLITQKKINPEIQNEKIFNEHDELHYIKALINKKDFAKALEKCEYFISQNNSNPEIYFLAGAIHEVKNDLIKAEEHFHKALYIEPFHYESIVHLIRIFEAKGEADKAELLRKRIDKITGMQ